MANDCLVVIDVQRGFINEWTRHLPDRVARLQADFARVAATRFYNPPGSPFRSLIGWQRLGRDTSDFELAFAPRPDALILDKPRYTALDQRLRNWLAGQGAGRVHLCGIATDNCVLKTAVDLFEAGFEPVVLADHCASHGGPECHDCGLRLLRRFIGAGQVVDGGGAG